MIKKKYQSIINFDTVKKLFVFGVTILMFFHISSCEEADLNESESTQDVKAKNYSNSSKKFFHYQKYRGFNISPWTQNNELDEIVEQTKANILRLSFTGGVKLMKKTATNGSTTDPSATYPFDPVAFAQLDRILNWAKARGDVKILIDPHTVPGFASDFTTNAKDNFWHNPLWKNHLIKLWDEIIDKVGHRGDEIAGYDLLNEPEIPDPDVCNTNQWNNIVNILVKRIRAKGAQHPIIIEPAGIAMNYCNGNGAYISLSAIRSLPLLVLPNDDNLVVSPHFYDPLFFTHQGVVTGGLNLSTGIRYPGTIPNFNGYPVEYWDKERINLEFNDIRKFSSMHPNVPIFIGEFSVARAAGPDGDIFINDFLQLIEEHGWSWANHAWGGDLWNPAQHYTVPLSNENHPDGNQPKTAPRINLLRQYMYRNLPSYPPSDKMIHGLYRLKSQTNGDELLTYDLSEVSNAFFSYNYKIEGVIGRVADQSNLNLFPVYRLRNTYSQNRLLTTSYSEKISAINNYGYIDEGIAFYAAKEPLNNEYVPVYRLIKGWYYRYVVGTIELNNAINSGWILELEGKPLFYCRSSKLY